MPGSLSHWPAWTACTLGLRRSLMKSLISRRAMIASSAELPVALDTRPAKAGLAPPPYTVSINIEIMFPRTMTKAQRVEVVAAHGFKAYSFWSATETGASLPGAININTAGLDVLVCLPGVSRELAQAVISQRQSGGFFANTGELLKVPGLTSDMFKQIAPLVTTRSETFRILSEGKINSSGARQRIQAIIHVGLNGQKTLSWREDDL